MKLTPRGTPVGVENPYEYVSKCDHLTGSGMCRLMFEDGHIDLTFREMLQKNEFNCPVVSGEWEWKDCPKFRFRTNGKVCARCGLEEHLNSHDNSRPLLEKHHLSYAEPEGGKIPDREDMSHEITITLCRWCHAKVHKAGVRIDDCVEPDLKAIKMAYGRKKIEDEETVFKSARERYEDKLR